MSGNEHRDFRIRRARPGDSRSIAAVLEESFREYESLHTPEAFAATTPSPDEVLSRMTEGPMWVVTREGAIVGTVASAGQGRDLYIRGMAIALSARERRIGWALREHIEDFSETNGYTRVWLSTTLFLTRAIGLYEHFGFERTDEGPYDLPGTPLFTMEKKLRPSGGDTQ